MTENIITENLVEVWKNKKPFSLCEGQEISDEIDFIDDEKLEPLSEDLKEVTAKALQNTENMIKRMITESANVVGDIATFIDMLLPMVRRSVGRTDLLECIGTQQLNRPDDYIFIEKAYYSGKGDAGASEYYDENGDPTVMAITTDGDLTFFNNVVVQDGSHTGSAVLTTDGTPLTIGKVLYKERTFDGRNAFLIKRTTVNKLPAIGVDITIVADAELTFKVEGAVGRAMLFSNYNEQFDRGVSATLREFNEVSMTIKKVMVQAVDRTLAFRYDINMLTDMMKQFGVAGKKRVTDMIVYEYALESNKKIFNLLMTSAYTAPAYVYANAGGSAGGLRPIDKYDELERKIMKEQSAITARNNTGNANKMIVSINVGSILANTVSWKPYKGLASGIYKAGNYKGMDVFINTTLPANYDFVWMGTKVPGNPFKAPAFLGMYVPLFIVESTVEKNPLNKMMLFVERNIYSAMPDNPTDFGTKFDVTLTGSPYVS